MTKIDIVDEIAKEFGLSRRDAVAVVNAVLARIVAGVEADGRVEARGLGVFSVATRPARKAHNPRTGATIDVPARRAMRFRQSAVVAERLNAAKVGADNPGD
jgi:nucleoid DNA-binding protein